MACVYYIHGGGMTNLSCFDGMYRGWGKLIAANGVAVVMVDFRNAISPSSVPEVAPYPAGLERLRLRLPLGGRPRRRPGRSTRTGS